MTNVDLVVVSRIQAAGQQHNVVCSGGGGVEEERLVFPFEVESIGRTKEMSTRA